MTETKIMIDNDLMLSLNTAWADYSTWFEKIKSYRRYEAGIEYAPLNPDQAALFVHDPQYRMNVCPLVLNAKIDRLKIESVTVTGPDNEPSDEVNKALSDWLVLAEIELLARDLHYQASRDGDAYLFVAWDEKAGRPVLKVESAFDGETGAMMFYEDGQPYKAMRQWSERNPSNPKKLIYRRNFYYPDRVVKEYSNSPSSAMGGWLPYVDENNVNEYAHIDAQGRPLGIPIIHFSNVTNGYDYGTSDLEVMLPQQKALNMVGMAQLAATMLAGTPVNYIFGLELPPKLKAHPGAIVTNKNPSNNPVTVGQFPAANLAQITDVETAILKKIGTITSTPLSHFMSSGQIASEGTLQQQEAPLIAKVKSAQADFGGSWHIAYSYIINLGAAFGAYAEDDYSTSLVWANPAMRDKLAEAQTSQIHQALGVPQEMIWRKLGYTAEEIAEMQAMKTREGNTAIINMASQGGQNG